MIGTLSIGKKAAKYGYKRYGVPGAVVAGAGGAAGVVVAKKAAKAYLESDADGETGVDPLEDPAPTETESTGDANPDETDDESAA